MAVVLGGYLWGMDVWRLVACGSHHFLLPSSGAGSRPIIDSATCLQSTLVLPVLGLVLPPVHPPRVAGGAAGNPRGPWLPTVGTDRAWWVRAADTDYFQREVRGRGLNRRPHDLVMVLETGVARLQLDPERRSRVDRHGLWVHSNRVLGATTRRVRELVERAEQVHLCRNSDCQGGPGVRCICFAAVDAESLVDLGAYDRLTAWRLGVLLWRGIYSIGSALRRWWRIMGTSVAPRRGGDPPTRFAFIGPGWI